MKLKPDNILIVFAQYPESAGVKPLLAERVGDRAARDIYSAFLTTTVVRARNIPGFGLRIDFDPGTIEAQRFFSNAFPGLPLLPQEGADPGEKMSNAFQSAFEDEYRRVCIIGGDSPDIPMNAIETAFDKLEKNDLVIGPGGDGGYYLIGLRAPSPAFFSNMEWRAPAALEKILLRAKELDMAAHALEPWSSVDTWDDLLYMMARLEKKIPLSDPLRHLKDALAAPLQKFR